MNTQQAQHIKHIEQKYCQVYRWQWSYLKPRHWPVWSLLGLLWGLGRLPMPAYLWVGKHLGRLLMHVLGKRKRIATRNITLCFPSLSAAEIEHLVCKNFEYAGIALLEPGLLWFSRPARIKKLYRIEGLEHFEQMQKAGKTVLLCGLHMQCLEAMGRILGEHITTNHLYRVNNNPVYEYMSGRKRSAYPSTSRLIPHKRIRDFLYLMQSGQTGSIVPDHDLGRKSSLFIPFFGQLAATVPAVSVYAHKTKATVLMMDYFLDIPSRQYIFRISPPIDNFPTNDKEADTLKINQLIEERVREHPEQYLWMHRRFKTRPDKNAPSLYQ